MGIRIEAVSALTSHGLHKPTARRLADAAARSCLAHARREPSEIDMLINAGVYREDNMGEPALAALSRPRHLLLRPHERHLRRDQRDPA
jgi:3-oxoacyl-[acyl-carrier-protein] synthase III